MTDAQFLAWLKSPDSIRLALVQVVTRIAGAETTLYLSNRPYATDGADSPANTMYVPCIVGGVSMEESLSLDGSASVSYGDLEIDNRDGSRDGWLDYVWANRRVQVFVGDPRWPRSDFRQVFDGVTGDLGSRSMEVLNLPLLDNLQRLNNPAIETLLGGTTDNKERQLPTTLGECHNITPLLTNPATLEYQVHNGAIEDIIEVRDNGLPVVVTKLLAIGRFRLLRAPAGTVTASVQGDKPSSYNNTISTLVQRLATGYGPTTTRFSASDIDTANFATFAAAHPQPVGLNSVDRINIIEACQSLARSVGAQVVCNSQGLLRLIKLALPATGTPILISDDDIDAKSLSITERTAVKSSCKLGYCKNWTVQASGMAAGLPAKNAALFAEEWLTTTQSDSSVATIYKLDAQPVQEDTLLLVELDAQLEAQRRRNLWRTPRTVYNARCRAHLMLTELGDTVTLTHPRLGLSAGKTGIVVNIGRDWLAGRITIGVLV